MNHTEGRIGGASSQRSVLGNEGQLVDEICEPGGIRIQPAREDLNRFLSTCAGLRGPKLAEALRDKIVR